MLLLPFLLATLPCLWGIPVEQGAEKELVVVTEATTLQNDGKEDPKSTAVPPEPPTISEMHIKSNITNRFSHTSVKSKVKNPASIAQETTFFLIIPDQAYISSFVMEIGGKNYTAHVQEKEQAKKTYDDAISRGYGAAHVGASARDSNKFTVSVNVEPESKAVFYLTYEELLERKDGQYEQVINMHPKQLVKDLTVEVDIAEERPLVFVKTPAIRSGNEIAKESEDLLPNADISRPQPNTAHVKFAPDNEKQKQIAQGLGNKEEQGLSGQFVVQYEVERDPHGGEVLVKDGYFVHFFAPSDLQPLNKHVVFILDTSGSMYDRKMEQLKHAMRSILGELNPDDYFNLVEFNSNVKTWNLDAPAESTVFPEREDTWYESDIVHDLSEVSFPPAYPVNNNTIEKANKAVKDMYATGGTNIYEALRVGVHLVKLRQQRSNSKDVQPLIFFLTDGDPTVGRTSTESIISGITEENLAKIPIISLSFGNGADRDFLKKISLNNFGLARHIYEESDASLQLENFYKEVSSPLLHNVKFKYEADPASLTTTDFPIFFQGSEFVVSGKINEDDFKDVPFVECFDFKGPRIFRPAVKRTVGQLERLWAYMTVRKYLDAKKANQDGSTVYDDKALELSLKYSFVTPVTSLVVVKPNDTSDSVDAVAADDEEDILFSSGLRLSAGVPNLGFSSFIGAGDGSVAASVPRSPYFTTPAYFNFHETAATVEDVVDGVAASSVAPEAATLPPEFKDKLPWLEQKLRPDGGLSFFKGSYKLGFNETSPEDLHCTTPKSEDGFCKLLKDCEKLHVELIDVQSFKDHFCIINDAFAGVCCPKEKEQ